MRCHSISAIDQFCNNNYLLYEWGLGLHTLPSKLEAIISAPKPRS